MADLAKEQKIKLYTNMVRVRMLDRAMQRGLFVTGKIKGHFISGEWQEAIGVGACTFLRKDDYIFYTHRGMGTAKTILISEPGDVLSSQLNSFLTELGFNRIHVKTLKETLLTIQGQKVDVLVLDADLLGDDCGFISIIKGMEEDLPIILCAETNTPEFESKVRRERIFFYHIKSFGAQDLEMAISNALNRTSL